MTDTERVEQAARSFLADRPDHEDTLEKLLTHEQEHGSWEFDDAPVESGLFGELVSREFVENTADGGYRFTDRQAVSAALHEDNPTDTQPTAQTSLGFTISLPSVDRRVLAGLLGGLLLVVVARSLFFQSVFTNGRIVSPANDSYFFRYWQAELLAQSNGLFDLNTLSTVGEVTNIRPLTHVLYWWFAELSSAPGLVAALVPVVTSVIVGVLIYELTQKLTADHRIALAAVVLFALTPAHATYTALGFSDHGPYQYLWIGLMIYALGWLAMDVLERSRGGAANPAWAHTRTPRAWGVAALLTVAVGALAHTWGGSPLSFIPIAVYVAVRVIADVKEGVDPLVGNLPALGGITLGSLFALGAHVRWGWHESIAATVPVAVAVGALAVAVLAHLWFRVDLPAGGLLAAEGVVGVVGVLFFRWFRPDDVARLVERSDAFFNRETATETASLFSLDQAIILGPMGQIGIGFYLALVPLLVVTYYVVRNYEPGWLVVTTFTWFYLAIATFQLRFAAKFAIPCAIFGAVGLVYVLDAVDLARPVSLFDGDAPDGRPLELPATPTVGVYLVGAIGLVLLLNLIFVPSLLAQIQYSEGQIDAVDAIDNHAEELNRTYPENFVLSDWGDNRMYNHFVNGESRGYGYARGRYEPFISDTNPDEYFDQFNNRVGYVVMTDTEAPAQTVQAKLFEELGAGNESVAHYQLIHSTDDVRAFALVKGAVINATASPGETVTARTNVTTEGESFTYERIETAAENGTLKIRVAYPGEYEVGETTVTVTEQDIYEGRAVSSDG
ncbi:dolichyl-diphosphooligosaccharide--protein glycosyltransferase [Halovenus aranensis]|uniref:Dolichyl-diphosphooligosaccharide--protein glycosyltransferase n=1 Tax=Halovenus aranensis TaxID=890420 RepID=A0A1G8ZAV1_9EURY|nr:hypothetical protein [Halovenus aranensis]SDK11290.1 dolichyl-diphosphooligosaccharide--protein glycosyltransferase [Halovenus aranensis]